MLQYNQMYLYCYLLYYTFYKAFINELFIHILLLIFFNNN